MLRGKKTFLIIYTLEFFWALAYAIPLYAQSSFLEQFLPTSLIGLYITAATITTIVAIFLFPHFIKKYHNYTIFFILLIINIVNIVFLVSANSSLLILPFYIIFSAGMYLLAINLDIFLENITDEHHTGTTRTIFLTIMNTAILFAPLIMGFLIQNENYDRVFIASALLLIPMVFILLWNKRYLSDHIVYRCRPLHKLLEIMKKNANLRKIFSAALTLRIFFSIMVLYTPIYLHEYIHFSWEEIGMIFFIMLLPYVFIQYPAGKLADKSLGEKELLITGLIIMIIFTGMMFFTSSTSLLVWAGILFMTRIGAALLESMSEVYFFSLIQPKDVDLIYLLRDTRPAGWLIGSTLSVILLVFLPLPYLFLMLSLIMLIPLRPLLTLKDTQ